MMAIARARQWPAGAAGTMSRPSSYVLVLEYLPRNVTMFVVNSWLYESRFDSMQ
jgi:hypothetical protein